MRAYIILLAFLLSALLTAAQNKALVKCDACVAVTTEMCAANLKHQKALKGGSDKKKSKKASTPMSVVMAETLADVCHIDRLRKYGFPPPVLTPACNDFVGKYSDEIDEFFEKFQEKDMQCRGAIEEFCGSVTEVCKGFEPTPHERGGTPSYEYREKGAKADDDSTMKTWGTNVDEILPKGQKGKPAKAKKDAKGEKEKKKGDKEKKKEGKGEKEKKKAKKGKKDEL